MRETLRRFLTPGGSSRRWFWLAMLAIVLIVLGLTGNLRQF
ncbi:MULTISPECIES: hypothetical protein [unclassified Devosia]|jgi:hypothetical protein|nr:MULTISPECIES: hypothetical protein [unclassified Devosia]WEJ33683.1 DUF3112 domain-containing protein [Devosia sp. SD17-2]